jgi:serine/threonine protein kinase
VEASALISRLLTYSPVARPSLRDVLSDPWFHSGRQIRYQDIDIKFDYRLAMDKSVLAKAAKFGISEERITNAVFSCEINPASAFYYMLLSISK